MYRVFDLFKILDYSMVLSQGALMLLRNYLYVFFTVGQGLGWCRGYGASMQLCRDRRKRSYGAGSKP